MNDKEIDTVVNACDAGREGESIFRLVYNEAKCKKKMQRLWISSMEDIAIKEGFDNLKDGKAYDNLFESAQGFRVIIMTQAHSQVNTRVLEQLLQK